jgi:hypothetical protein
VSIWCQQVGGTGGVNKASGVSVVPCVIGFGCQECRWFQECHRLFGVSVVPGTSLGAKSIGGARSVNKVSGISTVGGGPRVPILCQKCQ